MARGDLILRIGADDSPLRATLKRLNNDLLRTASKLESIGQSLSLRLSLPIAAAGTAAIASFAKFEKLEKGLLAVSGSAVEANQALDRLRKLALEPGIDLQNAVTASIRLQAVGFEAQKAEDLILQFSKAVTIAGGTGEDLGEVVRQITQIISKGKILSSDFRVIQERVPAVGIAMEKAFGTTNIELIRETGISAGEFVDRLTDGIRASEQFQNVQGGLSNSLNNFQQSIEGSLVVLGRTISETINLEGILDTISNTIADVTTGFANLSPQTKTLILGIAGLTAAIGPLSLGIGALLKTLPLLRAGFALLTGPIGLVSLAIGALALAFLSEATQASAAEVAQQRVNEALKDATALAEAEKAAVDRLVDTIENETSTKGDRARAIEELKRIAPDYFGDLDVEKIKTEQLTDAVDNYSESLKKVTLQKLNQQSLEAQERLEKLNRELNIANSTAKQTAGQFGNFAGAGINQATTRLEREKEELQATIQALAVETGNVIDQANSAAEKSQTATSFAPITQSVETQVSQPTINPLEGIGSSATNAAALLEEADRSIRVLNTSLSETQQLSESGFAKLIGEDFALLAQNIQTTTSPLSILGETFSSLQDQSVVFGESFDLLTEKINATKSAIQLALEEGFSPTSTTVTALTEVMAGLNEQLEAQQAIVTATQGVVSAYTQAFNSSVNSQVKGFADVGRAALAAAAKVVKAKIQEATVNFIADAFAKLGIFGAVAAAGAGAIVGGLVSKAFGALSIPALAEGGIATSPTLALIGEGRESEAILPLSRLNSLIDNNNGPREQLVATIGIDELYIALQRYENENGRVN